MAGLKPTVDMCVPSQLTHTHVDTHIYTHVYGERAVFFRREARLSLSHSISSWSYIRGQREHTDIPARRRCQDQKSDWLLYAAGEKDREEEKKGREQRKGKNVCRLWRESVAASFWTSCVLKPIKALYSPSTNSPIFCKQRPYPLPCVSIYTCYALCIYCSQGYCCYCYLLLSRCQADGKSCTMLPTSCALFQLLKGTGPDGVRPCVCVCVCVRVCVLCVCLQVYTLAPGSSRTGTNPTGSSMQRLSLLLTKSASV